MLAKRKRHHAVFSMLYRLLAFSVLHKLVEAVPGVVVFVLGQVVLKSLVNGFDVRLYRMTDDICYTFGRFIDDLEVQRLVIAVKKVSFGEVLEAVGRE